jgi:hypothetical protein
VPWLRLEDNMLDHPKWRRAIREGGDDVLATWFRIVSWCSRNLTDGRVPADVVAEVAEVRSVDRSKTLRALADADLIRFSRGADNDLTTPSRGADVVVTDYLERNPSREQVLSERSRKSESQRKRRHAPPEAELQQTSDVGACSVPSHPIPPQSHPIERESARAITGETLLHDPEPEPKREPLPHELAEARAAAEPTGARPALRFEFRPDWRPKTTHRDLAHSLGLTDEEVGERLHDCRNKTYPNGFRSEDKQFNRELAWAARDKETRTFKAQQLAARKANPHGFDENPGARRRPDDPRPEPVFGRISAG